MTLELEEQALADFGQDERYLESAILSVRQTARKRHSWVVRTLARRIIRAAQDACMADGVKSCASRSPCGTGACPYALGPLASLYLMPKPGELTRPEGVAHPYPTFSEDHLVGVLRDLIPGG